MPQRQHPCLQLPVGLSPPVLSELSLHAYPPQSLHQHPVALASVALLRHDHALRALRVAVLQNLPVDDCPNLPVPPPRAELVPAPVPVTPEARPPAPDSCGSPLQVRFALAPPGTSFGWLLPIPPAAEPALSLRALLILHAGEPHVPVPLEDPRSCCLPETADPFHQQPLHDQGTLPKVKARSVLLEEGLSHPACNEARCLSI
mmetsp:Transcript_9031/g.20735  ORF Transcript_9031/g.20735 Transcript_9031/m.20735 type:complete len:203 (-) Transcript_9031:308-916(-)